jgi:hypothetical protein
VAPALASKTTAGLLLPRGEKGAWDHGAISSPVVRVYQGDNEQRWLMWYSGCEIADSPNGFLIPGAGKIGVHPPLRQTTDLFFQTMLSPLGSEGAHDISPCGLHIQQT